jgi:hypothetical protein
LAVTHHLERDVDGRRVPVSETTHAAVIAAGRLLLGDRPAGAALPAPGQGELRFVPADPAYVATAPVTLAWTARPPYTLAGGFAVDHAYDGQPVTLSLTQTAGPRSITALDLTLDAADQAPLIVRLERDGAHLRSTTTFSPAQRATWRLPATVAGGDGPIALTVPTGAFPAVAIVRDWFWIIVAATALLAALLAALLWWWLTRPRFRQEVVAGAEEITTCREHPGPAGGPTTAISPRWNRGLILRATRGGVVVDRIAPGASLFINLCPAAVGDRVDPGNDLELVQPSGQSLHGRFLTARDQAALPPQIDLPTIADDLVILEI